MDAISVTRKIARANYFNKFASKNAISPLLMNVAKRPETLGASALGGLYGGMQGYDNATDDQKGVGAIGGALAGAVGGGILGGTAGSVYRSMTGGKKGLIARYNESSKKLDRLAKKKKAESGFFKTWYKPYTSRKGDYMNQEVKYKGETMGRLDKLKQQMSEITDNRNLSHKKQVKKVDKLMNKTPMGKYVKDRDELIGNAAKVGLGGWMGLSAINSARDFGAAPDPASVASDLINKSENGNKLSPREMMLLQQKLKQINQ
jgi:hypothetical protein